MNLHATEAEATGPRGSSLRFAFNSGARPLPGYTIKRGIGRGGFGEVFFAVSDAGKEVALKLVRRNLEVELRGVTQCLNLKHPHLVAIYDMRQDDEGNSWIIMEYVSGQSLEEAIAQHPHGMPPDEAMHWLRGIAAGASYLHDHGIVHRDLKPGNVFCDERLVKLGDYGLSKFISCSRRSGHTESIGTVHYMAPEVANGRYGKEIDIYALGIILYEMLTGRVPFEGESIGEVLMKHLTAEPNLDDLKEPYRSVAARALAKDPEVRYRSVDELMSALGGAAGTVPVAVAPPPLRPAVVAQAIAAVSPAAAPLAAASVADEDPVWRAVCDTWQRLAIWWNESNLSMPARVLLVFFALLAVVSNAMIAVRLLLIAVVGFGTYRLIRAAMAYIDAGATAAAASQAAPAVQAVGAAAIDKAMDRMNDARRRVVDAHRAAMSPRAERPAVAMVLKSRRQKATELVGSMLAAALVAFVVSLVIFGLHYPQYFPEQCAWLAVVSTLGAWFVLVPAKLWEGTKGDVVLRRGTMLLLGILLGLAAYWVDQALLVELPYNMSLWPTLQTRGTTSWLGFQSGVTYRAEDGSPLASAYMIYFGSLFVLIRWWRHGDPLRTARLKLWPIATAVLAAWIPAMLWRFPPPWGLFIAAAISLSVQLSSPWDAMPKKHGEVKP